MTDPMPVVFIGHGSPLNAIQENDFTRMLRLLGERLARPRAILVVSAHWMTEGTWLTGMDAPKTIHDFYGFPDELFKVNYPAPGDPRTVSQIQNLIKSFKLNTEVETWGLDHGAWSVLRHMYPKADIPVIQLSIDMEQPPMYHYELGKELQKLRSEGVLILGSGNVVHNLRALNWETHSPPYAWAVEFDRWVKDRLVDRDFSALVHDFHATESGRMSIPTTEHFYPLLYVIGAARESDKIDFHFEEIHNASISMLTLSFGQ